MSEEKKSQPNFLWPKITDLKSATDASDQGYAISLIMAGCTGLLAVVSIFTGKPIIGVDAWSLVDAAIFAFIAWRIRKRSRVFAVVGLLFFILEKFVQFSGAEPATGAVVIAAFFLMAYIAGVRGTFAVHRYRATTPVGSKVPVLPQSPSTGE